MMNFLKRRHSHSFLRRCPSVTQVQESECGPASLGMLLAYYKCYVLLPHLSEECKVTRDGTHVLKLLSIAKQYGLNLGAKPYKFDRLKEKTNIPCMAYWQYSHWIVIEGYDHTGVFVNDPGNGRSFIKDEDFERGYSNIILKVLDSTNVIKQGSPWLLEGLLIKAVSPLYTDLLFIILFSTLFALPSLIIAFCTGIFVENVVQDNWLNWFRPVLAIVFAMSLLQITNKFLQLYLERRIKLKAQKLSAESFTKKLLNQKSDFFERRNPGEVSSRISQLNGLVGLITNSFTAACTSTLSTLIYLLVIFFINPVIGCFSFVIIIIYLAIIYFVGRSLLDKSKRLSVSSGYAYGSTLLAIDNAHSVKSMSLEVGVLDTWLNSFFQQSITGQQITLRSQAIDSVADFTDSVLKLGLILIGSLLVINNAMPLSSLVAISMLLQAMAPEIKNVVSYLKEFASSYGDIARISDALLSDSKKPMLNLFGGFDKKEDDIVVRISEESKARENWQLVYPKGLTFTYDIDSKFGIVLNEDLAIAESSNYHFTSKPGSGRTTFFKLLLSQNKWTHSDPNRQQHTKRLVDIAKICYFNERASFFPGKLSKSITTFDYDMNNEIFADICEELDIQKYIDCIPNRLNFEIDANQTNISFRTALMMDIARAISTGCTFLLIDYSLDSLEETFVRKLNILCFNKKIGVILSTRNRNLVSPHSTPLVFDNYDPSKQSSQRS